MVAENHRIVTLRCRACGHRTPPLGVQYCDCCFGALDLEDATPSALDPGARTATPLVAAPALGAALGLGDLWVKDETANPTGSFKDRVVAAAAGRALVVGDHVLAATSTGNLARALTWGAGRVGLRPVVVVPETLPPTERDALVAHGATVVVVAGGYDAANRVATEAAEDLAGWGWVNGDLRPWYSAGAGLVGHELADELGEVAQVVLPMASGALAFQVHRALAGRRSEPRLVVGQPAGCAPAAAAFADGTDEVAPVRPATRVGVLAMGDPPEGPEVVAMARRTGGAVVAVAEDSLDDSADLLTSTTGIVGDLATAVAVGAARRAAADGVLDPRGPHRVGGDRWPAPVARRPRGRRRGGRYHPGLVGGPPGRRWRGAALK